MENVYEYGTDWNLYENLIAFKNGEQNIHKTSANIKKLFEYAEKHKKENRQLDFDANVESEHSRLLRGE